MLQVLFTPELWVPLVNIRGVRVLPGVPRLFKAMIGAHQESLPTGPAHVRRELGTNIGEGDLAATLASIAEQFGQVRGELDHLSAVSGSV